MEKINYRDAGQELGPIAATEKSDKYYPTLNLDLDQFPEADHGIGQEFELMVKFCVKSKHLSEECRDACIEIRAIGSHEEEEESEESDERIPNNEADRELRRMKKPMYRGF